MKKNKSSVPFQEVLIVGFLALSSCSGIKPKSVGLFAPYPKTPNCVSTRSNSPEHSIRPYLYIVSLEDAQKKLIDIINRIPEARIAKIDHKFIHVEFKTKIFGFIDDVEFYFYRDGVISFRSASRLGYSDLGVNRNRMELIRKLFSP